MSMPSFPDLSTIPSLEQSLSAIVISIAMEEIALSHIIKAESEKIRFVIDKAKSKDGKDIDISEILAVNKSADELIKNITKLQAILKEKLETASKFVPHTPPAPPCVPKFFLQPGYAWKSGEALFLTGSGKCKRNNEPCNDGIKLIRKNCESAILLPSGKKYSITLETDAKKDNCNHAIVNAELYCNKKIISKEAMKFCDTKSTIKYTVPAHCKDAYVIFRLSSPKTLTHVAGSVKIFTNSVKCDSKALRCNLLD